MLPRVLEPEVMDSLDEARDYDSMDHSRVNKSFVDDFFALNHCHDEILDVGVGTARIPIDLCKRHKEIRVVGIDLAACMLQIAEVNVELANLRERILLVRQDAKRLTFDNHRFDAVISNLLQPSPTFSNLLQPSPTVSNLLQPSSTFSTRLATESRHGVPRGPPGP